MFLFIETVYWDSSMNTNTLVRTMSIPLFEPLQSLTKKYCQWHVHFEIWKKQ